MILLRQRTGPFHRIGDRYNTLFGSSDHFMGRSAFDDNWFSKDNHDYDHGFVKKRQKLQK